MNKYLFFDTETNGLPKDWKAPVSSVDNWPRIIQLAFAVFNEQGEIIHKYCALIKPDNWVIPNEKFWIDNGYSTEKSLELGIPILEAINEFNSYLSNCTHLIAHNMAFDEKIVGAEYIRLNLKSETKPIKVCTMQSSTNFCKIPNQNGYASFKWPKLEELHNVLFKTSFDGAHDALNDVIACAKCFFELKRLEVIKS
ncbi:MAG TPA: 3'-5' exonuclease [Bacteroidia bacterium]